MILAVLSPIAQHADGSPVLGIAGGHRAAFAVSAKIFPRIKTEARYISDATYGAPFVFRAVRLRGVFDHNQSMPPRNFHDRIHVGGLTVKMHGKNRLRSRRDR